MQTAHLGQGDDPGFHRRGNGPNGLTSQSLSPQAVMAGVR